MEHLNFKIGLDQGIKSHVHPSAPVLHRARRVIYHPVESSGYYSLFGIIPEITIRTGFSVLRMNHYHPDPIPYYFNSTDSPIMFAYMLEGERCFRFMNKSHEIITRSGAWYIGFIPDSRGEGVIKGTPRIRSIKIRMDPLVLYELLEGRVEGLPEKMSTFLNSLGGGVMILGGKINAAMKAAAENILGNPCENVLQQFQLESKVLDLLHLHLQEIYESRKDSLLTGVVDSGKMHAIMARDMLMESLDSPPGLNNIADKLGISPFTLKTAFNRVFGTSMHKYIQSKRMEAAKQLLEQGDMNVNEVAAEIGYSNVSRFIDAFNRVYCVKPGEYMRNIHFYFVSS